MAIAEVSDTTSQVRDQYESFPYPYRNADEEATRLLELIDGRRTVGQIVEAAATGADPEQVWEAWLRAFASLQEYDLVLLRHV